MNHSRRVYLAGVLGIAGGLVAGETARWAKGTSNPATARATKTTPDTATTTEQQETSSTGWKVGGDVWLGGGEPEIGSDGTTVYLSRLRPQVITAARLTPDGLLNERVVLIDSGDWSTGRVVDPSVVTINGQRHLYYASYESSTQLIGLAREMSNGFEDHGAVILTPSAVDAERVSEPHVRQRPDGTYEMTYSAERGGSEELDVAVSDDGVAWERHPESPVVSGNVNDQCHAYIDGEVHIWYTDKTVSPHPILHRSGPAWGDLGEPKKIINTGWHDWSPTLRYDQDSKTTVMLWHRQNPDAEGERLSNYRVARAVSTAL